MSNSSPFKSMFNIGGSLPAWPSKSGDIPPSWPSQAGKTLHEGLESQVKAIKNDTFSFGEDYMAIGVLLVAIAGYYLLKRMK